MSVREREVLGEDGPVVLITTNTPSDVLNQQHLSQTPVPHYPAAQGSHNLHPWFRDPKPNLPTSPD